MDHAAKLKVREFLRHTLHDAGDQGELTDHGSLFVSGRLDSLAMTRLVLFLEECFQIDFGVVDFQVELIDSLNEIQTLVDAEASR